jgi:GNAT superfamily N-acetyltransferase
MSNPETKNPEFTIRLAIKSDALRLAKLRYALRSTTGIATEPEVEFVQRCTAWMEEHLQNEAWKCWVAESNDRLIAAVWLQLVEKIPNPRSEPEHHAYITNFYVEEAARGRGIGTQLLRTALNWCEARQVHAVILWPTERSRTLYERHGFAVRDDIMELIIQSPVE